MCINTVCRNSIHHFKIGITCYRYSVLFLPPPRRLCFRLGLFVGLRVCLFVNKITLKLMDRF